MTDRPAADQLSRQVKMSRLASCNERLVLSAGQGDLAVAGKLGALVILVNGLGGGAANRGVDGELATVPEQPSLGEGMQRSRQDRYPH
jgi:hypothetical protein